ncbi:MAG: mechanosensitive ion channel family protein [Planctomycetota bacterium]
MSVVQDPAAWWEAVKAYLSENPTAAVVLAPLLLVGLWLLTLLIGRRLLLAVARRIVQRTSTNWDDMVLESGFLSRLSHTIPFFVVLGLADGLPGLEPWMSLWFGRISRAALAVIVVLSLHALLDGLHAAYRRRPGTSKRPIKGYIQLVKLLASLGGGAVAIATLVGSDVGSLVAGIGVSTAVVLFVFKDTILSFIASIQLTANDMVRIGDWIEMPKQGADGDVIDIALHTIKVQNWDKTITTIPTFELYAQSFKNWRGMQESGGRRIKRALHIDLATVRFLSDEDVERLASIGLLRDYLADKRTAVAATNAALPPEAPTTDRRRLTNVGTFRAYCFAYLKAHPEVHDGMTLLVRQLPATERGLPIELYLFTNTTAWAEYERIQADIFDHLLAVLPEFDLRPFQLPSGADVGELAGPLGRALQDGRA